MVITGAISRKIATPVLKIAAYVRRLVGAMMVFATMVSPACHARPIAAPVVLQNTAVMGHVITERHAIHVPAIAVHVLPHSNTAVISYATTAKPVKPVVQIAVHVWIFARTLSYKLQPVQVPVFPTHTIVFACTVVILSAEIPSFKSGAMKRRIRGAASIRTV